MKLRHIYLFVVLLTGTAVKAQQTNDRRTPTPQEIKMLNHTADSILKQLRIIFQAEVKENNPGHYQPERIQWVRQYLMLFQHFQTSATIVAYTPKHISQIFGKPDSVFVVNKKEGEFSYFYRGLEKKYINISNLRYRFYFSQNLLQRVVRE
jgi:hypothetical protein